MSRGPEGQPTLPGSDVVAALGAWRDGLVNLTGTNRALNFKHYKSTSAAIASPSLHDIFEGLRAGTHWSFEGEPNPEDHDPTEPRPLPGRTTLRCKRPDKELDATLRNLARRAKQEYLDRGLSVMYVALGALRWRDVDDTSYTSPLLLVPVEFIPMGAKNRPRLQVGEDDPTLNPALALRMSDFGLTLPSVDDLTDLSVDSLLQQVRSAVSGRAGWTVTEDAVLSAFSFQKEAMYRDLLANEATIIEHPLVRALANQDPTTQDGALLFEEIRAEDIDRDAPPEKTPLVLDADSSQRACVAAALAGRSFVMDGPPGTGKSQTIANMIGALLHAGKTVLFVSEKAAALEVVRNRLAEAGLENYLLELHSHKASRKEVATALATALDTIPVAPAGMDNMDRKKAADRRKRLNAYAEAMNKVRQPLGYSLHHVLGQIANLEHVPAAPTPTTAPVDLNPDTLHQIADATARLERAWRPASQGHSYLWREVTDRDPLDTHLYQAETALEELSGIAEHNTDLSAAFNLVSLGDLAVLVSLIQHLAARPPGVNDDWLTTGDFGVVDAAAADLSALLSAIRKTSAEARAGAGVPWTDLPDPATLPPSPTLTHLSPTPVRVEDMTATEAAEVADRFDADATMLEGRLTALTGLTTALNLPPVTLIHDVDTVLTLADAAFAPHRPERAWLTPEGLEHARAAAQVLRIRVTDLNEAESAARHTFTDAALGQPLAELHDRFTTVHKGLRKLFGDYRRDKKTVAAFTAEMVTLEAAISDLGLAVAWSRAATAMSEAEAESASILGSHWRGRDTDFTAIDQALALADEILRLTPPAALAAVTDHVTATTPEAVLKALIDQTRADLQAWRSALAPAPARAGRPDLLLAPLSDAVTWLQAHLAPLHDAATRARAVSDAVGHPVRLFGADHFLALRDAAAAAEATLAREDERFEATLGPDGYHGQATDEAALGAALAWAKEVRSTRHGTESPLTDSQVKAMADARLTENLAPALQHWQAAAERIVTAFDASRHLELASELNYVDSAASLLADLRADSSGQDEWFAYCQARRDLATHHLATVVHFCIDQSLRADQIGQVIQRAILRAWADHVLASDGDLLPVRAEDRAALIRQFQDLDRQLIPAATGDIIRAVNSRRPASTNVGEPALIRREGMKKIRHVPVRDLIRRTRHATVAIKPCFMMSPLAVSQFLPPDMQFDVVIFDEASQVTPGNAVNCIYRGKALITAGDDRQLPPTSFFDRMSDGEDEDTDVTDFQSILELAKASGAFRNLGLRWHYRSRHEALIAFSNHKFYEGKLVTYPGAHSEGPDVGVEMIHVPGVYRRGTTRDNPIEAAKVAERVIHHFDTRPETSLGVVTFSVAQADAIQSALDRALEGRPDLARHLEGDRLHGFFVKSLESVQGDERDVMIFSIGYGPDEHGKVTTNFGALNKAKGWRRLNVAITRARQRVEIVTSVRAGDVPDSQNESVQHLVGYLDYAERGMDALALDVGLSGLDTESPFEDSVLGVIRSFGYTAEPQVGAAGYRIDIGVRHPAHPGVFALGVECDGFMYHSSPAARDRDRLREQVLTGLGWRLHRIWGTAWYRNRAQEEERLRQAIQAAIDAPINGRLSGTLDHFTRPAVAVAEVESSAAPAWTQPYQRATVPPLPRWIDPSDAGSRWDMVKGIEILARDEGPVHLDLVHQRLRDAWNIGRVGPRIRENIEVAIRMANVVHEGGFLDMPVRANYPVRVPGDGQGQRTVAQVHDAELRNALTSLLRDAGTVSQDELMTATARIFGWNRRSDDMNARFSEVLRKMHHSGAVAVEGDTVRLSVDG